MLALRPWQPAVSTVAAVAVGVAAGVLGVVGVDRLGTAYVVLPVLLAVGWWLVGRPTACAVALAVSVALLENDPIGFLSFTTIGYRTFGGLLTPVDALVGVGALAVIVDHMRRPQPIRLPNAFVYPLVLLVAASASGAVVGLLSGADRILVVNTLGVLAYLVIVPLLVAHVVTSVERARQAVLLVAGLAVAKGVLGLVAVGLGQGRRVGADGSGALGAVLTYYGPVPNLLTMLLGLGVLALVVSRVPTSVWVKAGAVVCALSLALSYRRSFWIAAIVSIALVLIIASGRRGRALVLVGFLAVAGGAWLVLSSPETTSDSVLVERVRSIDREEVEANAYDRYRLEEQANVVDELRRRPLSGLGIGIPWTARHPLSIEHPGGRNYVHTNVLWFWLKLGPLGAASYAALHAVAILLGYRLWRRGPDPILRAAGLAMATGVVGLALAETTGSFTGVEDRLTAMIAVAYGWLGAVTTLSSSSEDDAAELAGR